MKNILILSPHLDQSIAVARYLCKYGGNIEVHGGFLKGEGAKSLPFFKKTFHINDTHRLKEYNTVLPTGAKSTHWLASVYGEFCVNGFAYNQNNLICFDKIGMLNIVQNMDIPVPKTFISIESINYPFPVFYKPKYEKGSGNRGVAYSEKDLINIPELPELFFQELIPGRSTYGVGYLAQKGKLITSFMHEESLSFPIKGGSAVCIQKTKKPILLEYTNRIVQQLCLSGWGLTEFKYCPKRNQFVFMELNAKLWASIEFAFLNNNQFLKYLFDLDYPNQNVPSAVFLDRLLTLGIKETLHQLTALCQGRVIVYQSCTGNLRRITFAMVPKFIKRFIRKILYHFKMFSLNWRKRSGRAV